MISHGLDHTNMKYHFICRILPNFWHVNLILKVSFLINRKMWNKTKMEKPIVLIKRSSPPLSLLLSSTPYPAKSFLKKSDCPSFQPSRTPGHSVQLRKIISFRNNGPKTYN